MSDEKISPAGRVCMFTGHRSISAKDMAVLSERIDATLERLIGEGFTDFCVGGAVGFDTLVELKLIEKKKKYGYLRLNLYLPCHSQERSWSESLKQAYSYVIENADSVRYASEQYTRWCMQSRNRKMVDAAELCVAYCRRTSGGTYHTVEYAKKKGLEILNLYTPADKK